MSQFQFPDIMMVYVNEQNGERKGGEAESSVLQDMTCALIGNLYIQ